MKNKTNARPTLNELLADCSNVFNKSMEDIIGHCKKRKFYTVRCIYCYVAFLYTEFSIKEIAKNVGYSDHSSAIHQRDLAIDLIDTNNEKFMGFLNHYKQNSIYFNSLKVIRYPRRYKEGNHAA
jgi:chromosomal replication initiation ATPase DnaA